MEEQSIEEKLKGASTEAHPISGMIRVQYTGEYDNYVANNGVGFFTDNGKIASVTQEQWEQLQHDEDLEPAHLTKIT